MTALDHSVLYADMGFAWITESFSVAVSDGLLSFCHRNPNVQIREDVEEGALQRTPRTPQLLGVLDEQPQYRERTAVVTMLHIPGFSNYTSRCPARPLATALAVDSLLD